MGVHHWKKLETKNFTKQQQHMGWWLLNPKSIVIDFNGDLIKQVGDVDHEFVVGKSWYEHRIDKRMRALFLKGESSAEVKMFLLDSLKKAL